MAQFQNIHATYVKVMNGLFLTKTTPEKSNYEYTNKHTGQKQYFYGTNGFQGTIHDITIEDSDFGKNYIFHIIDENGEPFKMVMMYGSGVAQGFLNALAAVAEEHGKIGFLKMTASVKVKDDKSYTSIWIAKNGRESYKWKYPIEELPIVKKTVKRSGKVEVDDEDRLAKFDEILEKEILPALKPIGKAEAALGLNEDAPEMSHVDDGEDIPF